MVAWRKCQVAVTEPKRFNCFTWGDNMLRLKNITPLIAATRARIVRCTKRMAP